ncbi:hypothetical protein BDZ94DRAFT_1195950 [Collybia nuda]|uniref:Uncharacterized protein n=1 Tax=Collybia nuda TaxID=64659 RepID=A0A9P6CGV9_9AGAR|nr:hypothetical protein BDZ94DRAFT_1195950 [Collybia nuda]
MINNVGAHPSNITHCLLFHMYSIPRISPILGMLGKAWPQNSHSATYIPTTTTGSRVRKDATYVLWTIFWEIVLFLNRSSIPPLRWINPKGLTPYADDECLASLCTALLLAPSPCSARCQKDKLFISVDGSCIDHGIAWSLACKSQLNIQRTFFSVLLFLFPSWRPPLSPRLNSPSLLSLQRFSRLRRSSRH